MSLVQLVDLIRYAKEIHLESWEWELLRLYNDPSQSAKHFFLTITEDGMEINKAAWGVRSIRNINL
jgi:hypothetical protein